MVQLLIFSSLNVTLHKKEVLIFLNKRIEESQQIVSSMLFMYLNIKYLAQYQHPVPKVKLYNHNQHR
ncbi:unnamed protein product [Paramecium octaurelia]|uniref:Uncharacterized protein n=1 Tax=Paramecium octaurelia TaxID=43137 RepID=A0A8S1TZ19_PAROT|nr:unnamed protein product [Paramecium octaurelia]CAD8157508.1 unnamed protein product [Paramecium octaurelia]